jgi:3,4-dihydroxy 2-butanone 4-phosphate synthase/GTP cyclohydrolase II
MNASQLEHPESAAMNLKRGLSSIARGGMAVIAHDAASEAGGVIVMAADASTFEKLSFMQRAAGGVNRVALPAKRAAALHLAERAASNDACVAALPCMPVDYRHNAGNGLLAVDTALTARSLVASDATARDFCCPGHLHTVAAADGGVLAQDGFAEAAVDLARLAGRPAGAVICDVTTEDGRIASRAELKRLAGMLGLNFIEVHDIVAYRRTTEALVERVSRRHITTKYGQLSAIGYRHKLGDGEMLALLADRCQPSAQMTVHVHFQCVAGEVLGSLACGCAVQLDSALEAVASVPGNCLIYISGHAGMRKISTKSCSCSHISCNPFNKEQTRCLPKEVRDVLEDLDLARLADERMSSLSS